MRWKADGTLLAPYGWPPVPVLLSRSTSRPADFDAPRLTDRPRFKQIQDVYARNRQLLTPCVPRLNKGYLEVLCYFADHGVTGLKDQYV